MKKIRMLSAYEYNGRKLEHVTRQISAEATMTAVMLESVIRVTVKGPTEDFEMDCQSFSLGEIIDVEK